MSIKPKWVAKILNGEKTLELRKSFPKDYRGWVYIYCTKADDLCKICKISRDRYIRGKDYGNRDFPHLHSGYNGRGKVVARFMLNTIDEHHVLPTERILPFNWNVEQKLKDLCLTKEEVMAYGKGQDYQAFILHIDSLEIFDYPKELNEFYKVGYLEERYAVESHLADIEGCDGGVNESYVDKLYEELDQEFQLTKAPQSWMYVEEEPQ